MRGVIELGIVARPGTLRHRAFRETDDDDEREVMLDALALEERVEALEVRAWGSDMRSRMQRGDAYAVDLYALWRSTPAALRGKHIVVWCDKPLKETDGQGRKLARVVVGDQVFDAVPGVAAVVPVIHVHDARGGAAAIYDLPDLPKLPRGVTALSALRATRVPTLTVAQVRKRESGEWLNVAMDWVLNWRETHDAATLARARDADDAREKRAAAVGVEKRRAGGLAQLSKSKLAPGLTGLMSATHANALRRILSESIPALEAATRSRDKERVLHEAVKKLNAYDHRHDIIATAEREALMESLEDLATASGLAITAKLNEWRAW